MGFTPLTLGSNHWERDKHFSPSAVSGSFVLTQKIELQPDKIVCKR